VVVDASPLGLASSPEKRNTPLKALVKDEIHLYFAYPERISESAVLDRYKGLLTAAEQNQMSRYYSATHRHQYLITRALIRSSLSEYFSVAEDQWRFAANTYGKPTICFPDPAPAIRFNISHTNGLIMCGVSLDFDIGVDVEDSCRASQAGFEELSQYFSAVEIHALEKLPKKEQRQRFFDYWTLKEAYIKARGMGLAIPLRQFSFLFDSGGLQRFETDKELGDDATDWQFWQTTLLDRYQVAIAANSRKPDIRISGFESVPLYSAQPLPLILS
jgi:4'-phosphopantetheinyl transferase